MSALDIKSRSLRFKISFIDFEFNRPILKKGYGFRKILKKTLPILKNFEGFGIDFERCNTKPKAIFSKSFCSRNKLELKSEIRLSALRKVQVPEAGEPVLSIYFYFWRNQ